MRTVLNSVRCNEPAWIVLTSSRLPLWKSQKHDKFGRYRSHLSTKKINSKLSRIAAEIKRGTIMWNYFPRLKSHSHNIFVSLPDVYQLHQRIMLNYSVIGVSTLLHRLFTKVVSQTLKSYGGKTNTLGTSLTWFRALTRVSSARFTFRSW